MFTGIIVAVGTIEAITPVADAMRLRIAVGDLDMTDVRPGDSIAVSGPCLTVVEFTAQWFDVDVSRETLACTSLGQRQVGDPVNLEKALRLDERLGGHIVSGHVDGLGEVRRIEPAGDYIAFTIGVPPSLARYLAFKGSVVVDGVSLTVNAATEDAFEILTIPHTLERTTLGRLATGDRVNIEVDVIARYVERLLRAGLGGADDDADISLARLVDAGFAGEPGR